MTIPIIFVALLFVGLINACYISYKREKEERMICPLNGDCEKVLVSKWSKMFGIHNEIWGMMSYILIASWFAIAMVVPAAASFGSLIIVVLVTLGFLYAIFLLGIQLFVIKDFCFYCLLSSFIQITLFGLVIFFG